MVYDFKDNSRVPILAQVAGERLEKIRVKHRGRLSAEAVVEDAQSERSPLHTVFEWNNKKAGEAYRLEQARHLIRSVIVVMEDRPSVRAFTRITLEEDHDATYTHITVAMEDPALREQVLARAERELESWRKRYADLEEFASVCRAIEQVAKTLPKPKGRGRRRATRVVARPKDAVLV